MGKWLVFLGISDQPCRLSLMSNIQAIYGNPRGILPFAPEGWSFIVPTLILVVFSIALSWAISAIVAGA